MTHSGRIPVGGEPKGGDKLKLQTDASIGRIVTFAIVTLILAAFAASQAYAIGGYWKPVGDKPYSVTFTDEAKHAVLGEFKKIVRWEWDDKGKVTVTEWDDQATFVFKDKNAKDHKIPNDVIKKRILDLAPGFTGKLRGNITDAFKRRPNKALKGDAAKDRRAR